MKSFNFTLPVIFFFLLVTSLVKRERWGNSPTCPCPRPRAALALFALVSDPPLFCAPEKVFLRFQVIPKALIRYVSMGKLRARATW